MLLGVWAIFFAADIAHLDTLGRTINLTLDGVCGLVVLAHWNILTRGQPVVTAMRNWRFVVLLGFTGQVLVHNARTEQAHAHFGLILNLLFLMQNLAVDAGTYSRQLGEILRRDPRHRDRRRGVMATFDAIICRAGGWFLDRPVREKSR